MLRLRALALPALCCAALVGAGCGSTTSGDSPADPESPSQQNNGSGGEQLAADDVATVLSARRAIDAGCRPGASATPAADVGGAVDSLVAVLRTSGPNSVYEVGSGGQAKRLTLVVDEVRRQLAACGGASEARRLAPWAHVDAPGALGS